MTTDERSDPDRGTDDDAPRQAWEQAERRLREIGADYAAAVDSHAPLEDLRSLDRELEHATDAAERARIELARRRARRPPAAGGGTGPAADSATNSVSAAAPAHEHDEDCCLTDEPG